MVDLVLLCLTPTWTNKVIQALNYNDKSGYQDPHLHIPQGTQECVIDWHLLAGLRPADIAPKLRKVRFAGNAQTGVAVESGPDAADLELDLIRNAFAQRNLSGTASSDDFDAYSRWQADKGEPVVAVTNSELFMTMNLKQIASKYPCVIFVIWDLLAASEERLCRCNPNYLYRIINEVTNADPDGETN